MIYLAWSLFLVYLCKHTYLGAKDEKHIIPTYSKVVALVSLVYIVQHYFGW